VPKKAAAVSEYSRKCEYGVSVLVSFHPPTQRLRFGGFLPTLRAV